MQSDSRKIKRVPSSIVAFTHRETKAIIKRGVFHSKHISSLTMDLSGADFLKKIQNSLQSMPLRKLKYSSFGTENQEMLILSTIFRKLGYKKLEKLSFLLQETEMARDGHVKKIAKNVRHLSKLTSLDFQIYNFYCVNGTFLAPLQQSLRLLPSLKHLKILNELCSAWNQDGWKSLLKSLDGLNADNIQSLYFDFSRVRKDVSQFLPELMRKVESFTQLKKLGLHLVEDPIQPAAFQESMNVIPKLKNLEEVSFSASEPITSEEYKIFMEAIGANPNIKKVYLKPDELKKPAFQALSASLDKLNSLEKLKLNLVLPNPPNRNDDDEEEGGRAPQEEDPNLLDDECLGKLALNLNKHSKSLKMFSLALNPWFGDQAHTKITTKGYGQIGEGLLNCSNIESLLLLYLDTLNSEDVVKNFQAIQNMKNIKSLVLRIKISDSASTDVFAALKDALASIKNVEKLYLILSNFNELTDKDIKEFLEEIANMHNMVDFCLQLNNVPKLTQASLTSTVETLKGLKSLKTAQLNFALQAAQGMFGSSVCLQMPDVKFENKTILIQRQSITFVVNALTHKLNHN